MPGRTCLSDLRWLYRSFLCAKQLWTMAAGTQRFFWCVYVQGIKHRIVDKHTCWTQWRSLMLLTTPAIQVSSDFSDCLHQSVDACSIDASPLTSQWQFNEALTKYSDSHSHSWSPQDQWCKNQSVSYITSFFWEPSAMLWVHWNTHWCNPS